MWRSHRANFVSPNVSTATVRSLCHDGHLYAGPLPWYDCLIAANRSEEGDIRLFPPRKRSIATRGNAINNVARESDCGPSRGAIATILSHSIPHRYVGIDLIVLSMKHEQSNEHGAWRMEAASRRPFFPPNIILFPLFFVPFCLPAILFTTWNFSSRHSPAPPSHITNHNPPPTTYPPTNSKDCTLLALPLTPGTMSLIAAAKAKEQEKCCYNYNLLIEFVHKHLDFHDAELHSILEMHGIRVGSDCHFVPVPATTTEQCNHRRPFRIVTFSWSSIGGRFSVSDQDDGDGGDSDTKCINLVSALSRCTLIRSVIELWGAGPTMNDCVNSIQHGLTLQRHQQGNHLGGDKKYEERSWSIHVHTLGATFTREEQNEMRSAFSFLNFPGKVQMKDADDEFIFIREVELDARGGAVYPRVNQNKQLIPENDARPPLACYFGRILGNNKLGRNWRGSNRLEQYSLKKRAYLGPTSMDSELSLIMTNLAQIRKGSFVFDPFVGTGSILLTAALRGAYAFGTDIDLRVLRGRSQDENIASNFKQYGLPPPELVRCDNAIYHRHFRQHLPLFDAIVTDPPYGIRAGARKSGARRDGEVKPILEEHRYDHVAQTRPYAVSDVMADLLNVAAMTLKLGGRLVYVIPSMLDFDENEDLPRHECMKIVSVCYQPLQTEFGRRTVTMVKIGEYDESKRSHYMANAWLNGAASADKVANIRDRLIEAAKLKPGYEEKAAIRKQKRNELKEMKKKAKREAAAKEGPNMCE